MTAAAEIITSVGRSTSLQQIAIKFIVRKLIDQQFETVSRVSMLACGQTLMWMDLIVKVLIWVENLWVALVTKNNVRKETRRLISQEM